MAETKSPSDRFHPGMPKIPGLPHGQVAARPRSARWLPESGSRIVVLLGAGSLLACALVVWILHGHGSHPPATVIPDADAPDTQQSLPQPPNDSAPSRIAPGVIARLDELQKPWSSLEFTFVRPDTHEDVPALVVRLPGTAGSSSSYWGFSLEEPYEKCQLVYVTDLSKLSAQFGFNATHPMVGDPCDGAVFDPLGMGTRPDGAWVRGVIVQGGALRPPISIELEVRGQNLYAERIE